MRITDFWAGWAVFGYDGLRLGIITEAEHDYVLISRSVPVSSIANVEHETIHLTCDEVLQMGWERPPRHVATGLSRHMAEVLRERPAARRSCRGVT